MYHCTPLASLNQSEVQTHGWLSLSPIATNLALMQRTDWRERQEMAGAELRGGKKEGR